MFRSGWLTNLFKKIPDLTTERLLLRKIRLSDAPDMYEYSKDPSVTQYLLWDPHPNVEHTRNYIDYLQDKYRDEAHLINGCQSRVWLNAELKEGKVYYSADSDAVITKGIVNLLIKVFSGQTPEDILTADLSFLDEIGLKEHLSPTRSNGLLAMLKQMLLYAEAFKLKEEQA